MRKSIFFIGVVVALLSAVTSNSSQSEQELAHEQEEIERQAIVAAHLSLLDSEAEAFWDLYFEYRVADQEFDDQRVDLLRLVKGSQDDVTDDEGIHFVTESRRIDKQRQALQQSYLMKFSLVLSGSKLFRYYQIETKLRALKRKFWASQVQLAPVSE
jgi:galactokinase